MTTTPFDTEDFNSAADESSVNDDKELRAAFGRASNAVRSLVLKTGNDDSLPHAEKVQRLTVIADNASFLTSPQRRDEQQAAPAAVGGGRSESSRSGDEDRDDAEALSKAQAAATVAQANVDKLRQAIEKLGGSSLNFDKQGNLTSNVDQHLKEAINKAKQEGRDEVTNNVPQDVNDLKATVKSKVDAVATAASSLKTTLATDKVKGRAELDAAVADLQSTVS